MKDVIKGMIDRYAGVDLAGYIAEELGKIDRLKNSIRKNGAVVEEENIRHQKKLAELKEELKRIQGQCRHQDFSFHGDPSGGNNSFHRCNICDKEW